jgi:hypothetical protein
MLPVLFKYDFIKPNVETEVQVYSFRARYNQFHVSAAWLRRKGHGTHRIWGRLEIRVGVDSAEETSDLVGNICPTKESVGRTTALVLYWLRCLD